MMTGTPTSVFSWNFRVDGGASGPALLRFQFFSEQGSIEVAGREFTVRKHGPLSGRWTLEREGAVEAEANKPSALFRSFEIQSGAGLFRLKAASAFTRSFEIRSGDRSVGTIRPAHAFTRRAGIECSEAVPQLVQLFAFWLTVLAWRRAANNNATPSSS